VCWSEPLSGMTGVGVGSTPGAILAKSQTEMTAVYRANAGPGASTTTSSSTSPTSSSSGSQATPATRTDSSSQSGSTNASPPTTGSPNSSTAASSTKSSSGGSSQRSSSGPETTKKSSSIGGGAIAFIAVGAPALLGATFAGGIRCTRRKNKSDPSTVSMLEDFKAPPSTPSKWGKSATITSELQAYVLGGGVLAASAPMSEFPAHQAQPVEMYAPHKP
jgi:hypothetical protein